MVAAPLLSNAMFTKSDGLNEPGTTVHKAVPDSTGAAEIHFHSHGDSTNNEAHAHDPHFHYHGGVGRSHLPPGADGTPVTMRSLLALGISGGLRPCPSALMLLLAAIAPHRVGFGLILGQTPFIDALVKSPRQTTFTLLVVYTLESETLYVVHQS
jgi:hypothetical protein